MQEPLLLFNHLKHVSLIVVLFVAVGIWPLPSGKSNPVLHNASSLLRVVTELFNESVQKSYSETRREEASAHRRRKRSPLPHCPEDGTTLIGPLNVTFEAPSFDEIWRRNPYLTDGGMFRPKHCTANYPRVAIVIPFRNRTKQLRSLLNHLHPILQRQQLSYGIFVSEQADNETFNKALLMNAAFLEIKRLYANSNRPFECFIFHDVDLFPEDDRGLYKCEKNPVHLSEYIDKFSYKPWDGLDVLFGGVVSMRRLIFEVVNGYSNVFFGWGGEDMEMRLRLGFYKIKIQKPDKQFYRYKMAKHHPDAGNPWNLGAFELIAETNPRMYIDGIETARYNVVSVEFFPTHTQFLITFSKEEIYRRLEDYNRRK